MEEKLKDKIEDEVESEEVSKGKVLKEDRHAIKNKLKAKDAEIEKLKGDIEHWKNAYFKAHADIQNLRKTLEKEYFEAIKYRASGFISELFPILDAFHNALEKSPNSKELQNYLVGFQYIYKMLISALEHEGVSEIAPKVGDKFNFKLMNAIGVVEGDEADIIVDVSSKGYLLKDRLLRPASVIVTGLKVKEEEQSEETPENMKGNHSIKGDA